MKVAMTAMFDETASLMRSPHDKFCVFIYVDLSHGNLDRLDVLAGKTFFQLIPYVYDSACSLASLTSSAWR